MVANRNPRHVEFSVSPGDAPASSSNDGPCGLKIAVVGSRGLPASYGGVERHVEEVGARLVERGHEVTVFVRPQYASGPIPANYRGMQLRVVPAIPGKHLEATSHSLLAALNSTGSRFNVVHFHALGPGLFSALPRLTGPARVVQTIHGLDDERAKWGPGAQLALRVARHISTFVPHEVVVVSQELQRVYREEHGCAATYLPNGLPPYDPVPPGETLRRLGLGANGYVMYLGRLVPEKDPLSLVEAFARVRSSSKLVIVGGSSNTDAYVARLNEQARRDPRVVLAGYQYGIALRELLTSAQVVVQPSHVEGLPLTLLEAVAYGRPVIASDIPPHVEILGTSGPGRRLFPKGRVDALADSLRDALSEGLGEPSEAQAWRVGVAEHYDWNRTVAGLERLYRSVASTPYSTPR